MNPTSAPDVVSLCERRAAKRDRVAFAAPADALAAAVVTDRGLTDQQPSNDNGTLVPRPAPGPSRAEVLAAVLDGPPVEAREGDRLSHGLSRDWLKLLLSRPEMGDVTQDEQVAGPCEMAPGLHAAGGTRTGQTHRASVSHLEQLAPQLIDELERITLPFNNHGPCDAELRVAQTQLDGWLEMLSHDIQAELFALQMAAQQQLLNIADLAGVTARARATSASQERDPSQARNPGVPAPERISHSHENT